MLIKEREEQQVKEKNTIKSLFARSEITVILATTTLFIIFSLFSDSFLSGYNLFNISRTAAIYIFIALGQAMVVIVGGMNLSLGQIGGLTVVISGYCMHVMGLPPLVAIVAGLIVGCLSGFINGFVMTKLKLNSFVVTLATSFIFTGLINGISKGYPYTEIPKSFTFLGREGFLGIPLLLWFALITLIIVGYIFKYTVTGRRVLATGGNIEAAKMSGINTNNTVVLANIASGFFAAVAGLLWISRTGSAQPSTGGDWMVISFAVAVIGGTALKGGVINVIGILFSSFLIVMVKNGLVMVDANIYFEQAYLGAILLLAVSLDSINNIMKAYKARKDLKLAQQKVTQSI
ncbi:ATPase [Sporanaerobium hydrogeniformans]|uniref:ATPase n=1 Tax=Sporanaerobium hydrogeniformans TaxID=3072179 RepID=A0AC61DDP5_9FIRM|nr:ATPase [Sporanaerobium hydrogeniformans]